MQCRTKSLLVVGLTLCSLQAAALAQTTTAGTPAGTTAAGAGPTTASGTKAAPIEVESVSPDVISKYPAKMVRVTGIVGDHSASDPDFFNFHTDDGADVNVRGEYPAQGHVTYTLTARVAQDGARYTLTEYTLVRKQEGGSGGMGGMGGNTPFIIAGVVLILAALATLGIMSVRNKADAQIREAEARTEEERRRADAARAEAERRAQEAMRNASGSHTPTVAADGSTPAGAAAPRASTIISVGSITVLDGPHAGQKFPLSAGETKIGRDRSKDCAVLLDKDAEVSSLHGALLARNDGRIIYKDSSRNGSVVDGKPLNLDEVEIHSGSRVEVGGSTIQITLRTAPGAGAASPSVPSPAASSVPAAVQSGRKAETIAVESPIKRPASATMASYGAELEVAGGPDAGRRFTITSATTTLGREDVDVILTDGSISRKHATLSNQDGKFILTDNNSTHGTIVNGASIRGASRQLANGDEILLGTGKTRIIFHQIGG